MLPVNITFCSSTHGLCESFEAFIADTYQITFGVVLIWNWYKTFWNDPCVYGAYPPCVVHNERRKEYLDNLEHADVQGATNLFVRFIAADIEERSPSTGAK